MNIPFLTVLLFLLTTLASAQVINIESFRKSTDSISWTGAAGLDFSIIKNKNSLFRIGTKAHVQYKNEFELWLIVNEINFQKVAGSSFVNKGIQHLRYNYRITPKIKMEGFVQVQYDAISEIDYRGLIGLGPRFKLNSNDDYRFYLGTLVMIEHEKASPIVEDRIQKDIRGSVYFSLSMYPTDNLSIISTSYYQPSFELLKDFRFSNESSLLLKIYESLALKTTFTYNFDAFPIEGIPKTQYELTNGLLYIF
ncbi:DUF481 domain-containing protein [Gelidibacter mesophilus]|uniref:DUF481 domain-containing protein n=1 Tax=Gelidibacter mesophilus TaxID=169050 RepID=UPI0004280B16|nr:DUF481 domain-containing protein [Gelidibacter mesophilus]